ncbi:early nodulin-like protein 1 [Ziziphus jujuba]|uniref:Early nodulin-like protein 1 n=1 Tax=Ziziphus jujuba TaxID=326968 RepID=A0ABM3ZS26_ZIZJJ|nr:early nodulin-like protein 1 [Ziziphus jujuba]
MEYFSSHHVFPSQNNSFFFNSPNPPTSPTHLPHHMSSNPIHTSTPNLTPSREISHTSPPSSHPTHHMSSTPIHIPTLTPTLSREISQNSSLSHPYPDSPHISAPSNMQEAMVPPLDISSTSPSFQCENSPRPVQQLTNRTHTMRTRSMNNIFKPKSFTNFFAATAGDHETEP